MTAIAGSRSGARSLTAHSHLGGLFPRQVIWIVRIELRVSQGELALAPRRVSDLWDEYQTYRVEKETERLYPHREILKNLYVLAA